MRILFTTYGTRPHYFPMVPLAWACQAAGHDVRIAGAPAIVEPLSESGLLGVSIGRDADVSSFLKGGAFRKKPPRPGESADDVLQRFVDGIAPIAFLRADAMVEEMVEYARSWRPDLVVYDPVTFAGPVAAQVLGVPSVCNLYGMVRRFRIEMNGLTGGEPRPEYLGLFERFGVEPLIDPVAWIDPCPPSLRWDPAPARRELMLNMRYVRYNGSGLIPDWLLRPAERPRVLVTWGTTQERKLGAEVMEFARRAMDSIARLDVEVVVTVGATAEHNVGYLTDLPENVRTVGWVPFHVLAGTCSVVVHTGGTGVVLTTAACGVPQLGISAIPEGTFNSEKVAEFGAGRHIHQANADEEFVLKSVEALLGDQAYADGARRLREEIDRQPAPGEVARMLEELAG